MLENFIASFSPKLNLFCLVIVGFSVIGLSKAYSEDSCEDAAKGDELERLAALYTTKTPMSLPRDTVFELVPKKDVRITGAGAGSTSVEGYGEQIKRVVFRWDTDPNRIVVQILDQAQDRPVNDVLIFTGEAKTSDKKVLVFKSQDLHPISGWYELHIKTKDVKQPKSSGKSSRKKASQPAKPVMTPANIYEFKLMHTREERAANHQPIPSYMGRTIFGMHVAERFEFKTYKEKK